MVTRSSTNITEYLFANKAACTLPRSVGRPFQVCFQGFFAASQLSQKSRESLPRLFYHPSSFWCTYLNNPADAVVSTPASTKAALSETIAQVHPVNPGVDININRQITENCSFNESLGVNVGIHCRDVQEKVAKQQISAYNARKTERV